MQLWWTQTNCFGRARTNIQFRKALDGQMNQAQLQRRDDTILRAGLLLSSAGPTEEEGRADAVEELDPLLYEVD